MIGIAPKLVTNMFAFYLKCGFAKYSVKELCEKAGYPELEAHKERVPWDKYLVLLETMQSAFHEGYSLEQYIADFSQVGMMEPLFTNIAGLIASPKMLFMLHTNFVGPRVFGGLTARNYYPSRDRIIIEINAPEDQLDYSLYFKMCIDGLITSPQIIGLPNNEIIEAKVSTHRLWVDMKMPPSKTLLARVKALFKVSRVPTFQAELSKEIGEFEKRQEKFMGDLSHFQQELKSQQKMGLLGTMVATIAHEINNPLTVASSNLQIAADRAKALDKDVLEHINIAKKAIDQTAAIVDSVSGFSSKNLERQKVSPFELLEDAIVLCSPMAKRQKIKILNLTESGMPQIEIDMVKAEVIQILCNVIVNAIQSTAEVNGNEVRVFVKRDDESVSVMVEDDGAGIPDEIQSKVFDPFFTSRNTGQNSGMGLSISKVLAEKNNAVVYIDSSHGPTRFGFKVNLI